MEWINVRERLPEHDNTFYFRRLYIHHYENGQAESTCKFEGVVKRDELNEIFDNGNLFWMGIPSDKWISIKEQQPENSNDYSHDTVLVLGDKGLITCNLRTIDEETNEWEWSIDCGQELTHWMPEPQDPKL